MPFDPVSAAREIRVNTPGAKSRFDTPRIREWIMRYVEGYEAGEFDRWDWRHLAKVLRVGDPSLPAHTALMRFMEREMPELIERLQKAR